MFFNRKRFGKCGGNSDFIVNLGDERFLQLIVFFYHENNL